MKPGGYRDSGADIAFALDKAGVPVITPVNPPFPESDADWVFPDTLEGMNAAYEAGARIFWLNTVLFVGHPVEPWLGRGIQIVGQDPSAVQKGDDKFSTNQMLFQAGLSVAHSRLVSKSFENAKFPAVLKPVRGRGSQGVHLLESAEEFSSALLALAKAEIYGTEFILEEWLPGQEITISVLPEKGSFRALPPVLRLHHVAGIAPYNGLVAVSENSRSLSLSECKEKSVVEIFRECETAARLVGARSLIRIDCRQDEHGKYKIFDLNMKPNMTGPGRPGRENQSSLSAMAAKTTGWSYTDLLLAMLDCRWESSES